MSSVRQQKAVKFLQQLMIQGQFDFEKFDSDGDGFLSHEELAAGFSAIGYALDKAQMDDIVSIVDTDGDGKVDFSEFEALHKVTMEVHNLERKAEGADWDDNLKNTKPSQQLLPTLALWGQFKGDKLVAKLKELGEGVNAVDTYGISCLMQAAIHKDKRSFLALLAADAGLTIRAQFAKGTAKAATIDGRVVKPTDTALTFAIENGWVSADAARPKEAILEGAAAAKEAGAAERTAGATVDWSLARSTSTTEMVCLPVDEMIAKLGGDVNVQDKWGFTTLHHAKIWKFADKIAALEAAGADASITTTAPRSVNGVSYATGTAASAIA